MSNVKEMRIFSAEQIVVPDEFPKILKDYTKEIVRKSPEDVIKFSKAYFEAILKDRGYFDDHLDKLNVKLQSFVVRKKNESVHDHYEVTGVIGDPYDSKARLGVHKKTGLQRAIKVVDKSSIEDMEDYMSKVALLNSLDHPNIVRYLEIFEDDYNFYFVSEYMQGGDLWNGVMTYGGQYTEEIAATVIKQLLQAAGYLHKKGIIHRNIRTGNILFTEAGKLSIKLIDFDVAGTKTLEACKVYGGGIHGPFYSAPEVFRSEYNDKCDVWSIGVTLYFLIFGYVPFYADSHEEVIRMILKGQYKLDQTIKAKLSYDCIDLLSQILKVDVNERLSAEQALNHPWFQKAKKGELKGKELGNSLDNLKNFTAGGKLKQALLGFFVQNMLSQQELNNLAEQFKACDVNGNGTLSPHELKQALKEVKGIDYNEKDVNDIIKKIDADEDGEVNYSEWLMSSISRDAILSNERLDAAFKMFDANGDGELTVDELKGMLEIAKTVDEAMVQRAMKEIDNKHKSTIQFQEFKVMMQRLFE